MSLSRYQAFSATADQRSLTKAAELLGYTQSGISHLLTALESELGLTLLIRSRSGVQLTSEGEHLLPYVKNMLAVYQDVQTTAASLRNVTTGLLQVGTFSSVAIHWMPHIINSFNERYPGVTINIHNCTYSIVENDLLENEIDCGFVTLPTREEFAAIPLRPDRLMVIIHRSNPLSRQPFLTPEQISQQPFILPAEGTHYDIGKAFAEVGASMNIQFDVSDDYAALALVREGLGITILPELIIRNQPLLSISAVPLKNAQRVIGLATMRLRRPSPLLEAFLNHVKQLELP